MAASPPSSTVVTRTAASRRRSAVYGVQTGSSASHCAPATGSAAPAAIAAGARRCKTPAMDTGRRALLDRLWSEGRVFDAAQPDRLDRRPGAAPLHESHFGMHDVILSA